jgi:hypothetical protein
MKFDQTVFVCGSNQSVKKLSYYFRPFKESSQEFYYSRQQIFHLVLLKLVKLRVSTLFSALSNTNGIDA